MLDCYSPIHCLSESKRRMYFSLNVLFFSLYISSISNSKKKTIFVDSEMSVKRRQLFVGVLENSTWTNEKLCAYLIKHACTSDEQFITDCQIMSYNEERFRGKHTFWREAFFSPRRKRNICRKIIRFCHIH